jgi:hypothetical protein
VGVGLICRLTAPLSPAFTEEASRMQAPGRGVKRFIIWAIFLIYRPRSLLMDKVCVDFCATFHKIIDSNVPILSNETFAKDLGLKFQSIRKGRFCSL